MAEVTLTREQLERLSTNSNEWIAAYAQMGLAYMDASARAERLEGLLREIQGVFDNQLYDADEGIAGASKRSRYYAATYSRRIDAFLGEQP